MTIENTLERIALALETLAARDPGGPTEPSQTLTEKKATKKKATKKKAKKETSTSEPSDPPVETRTETEETPGLSLPDVLTEVGQIAQQLGPDALLLGGLLRDKYQAEKVSDLPADKYHAFLTDAKALLPGGEHE